MRSGLLVRTGPSQEPQVLPRENPEDPHPSSGSRVAMKPNGRSVEVRGTRSKHSNLQVASDICLENSFLEKGLLEKNLLGKNLGNRGADHVSVHEGITDSKLSGMLLMCLNPYRNPDLLSW